MVYTLSQARRTSISLRFSNRNFNRAWSLLTFLCVYRAASMLPVNSATRALIRATRDSMALLSISTHIITSIWDVREPTFFTTGVAIISLASPAVNFFL